MTLHLHSSDAVDETQRPRLILAYLEPPSTTPGSTGHAYIPHWELGDTGNDLRKKRANVHLANVSTVTVDIEVTLRFPDGTIVCDDPARSSRRWIVRTQAPARRRASQ